VKYFCTADLSGCRLEFGADARPKVAHIAASAAGYEDRSWDQMGPEATKTAEARLNREAAEAFGGLPHRKYSKRSQYRDATAVTVVGFRKDARWEFYAQQQRYDREERVTRMVMRQIVIAELPEGV
jgi:hypothetical protein